MAGRAETTRLIRRVARRQEAASVGARLYAALLVVASAYAALLLCSRLLALIPDVFEPATLLVVPGLALALGFLLRHRPAPTETARLIDRTIETDDLFLTATLIGESPAEYGPLVLAEARQRSLTVNPAEVIRFRWGARARDALLVMAVLLAGVAFLPQFDPFGKEADRLRRAQRRAQLGESRKATKLRTARLQQKKTDARHSDKVQASLDGLMKTFNGMKPTAKQGNLKRLGDRQKELGELWRKISQSKLRDAFGRMSSNQRFGGGDAHKTSRWKRQLQKGDLSGLKKELAELKKMTQELAKAPNSPAREQRKRELSRRLRNLSDFLGKEMNSKSLNAALNRALQQLAMGEAAELSQEAMQALQESLELSALEMESLAQSLRDLQALEEGLRAMQLAKRLNEMRGLDGQACSGCEGIADYADLYEKMMGGGRGEGPGMRGPGRGKGGKAPEDDEQQTDFVPRKSQSSLTAGRMLMQWKTQELAKPGRAREDYARAVEEVKQGVSEAILHEQVPPGYHQAIKKYFDNIQEQKRSGESK